MYRIQKDISGKENDLQRVPNSMNLKKNLVFSSTFRKINLIAPVKSRIRQAVKSSFKTSLIKLVQADWEVPFLDI